MIPVGCSGPSRWIYRRAEPFLAIGSCAQRMSAPRCQALLETRSSLAFAISFVVLWYAILWWLYRRNMVFKV